MAELDRGLRVAGQEDLLDRGGGRAVPFDDRAQFVLKPEQAIGQSLLRIGADLAVGDMAQPVPLGGDHPPAGAAEARIEADDDQPSFSSTASDTS